MTYPTIEVNDRRVVIKNSATKEFTIVNVHSLKSCSGDHCVIHNPSDHHLRHLALTYRQDKGLFERICKHGIGHPDPDSLQHFLSLGLDDRGIHGCDGCCSQTVTSVQ